MTYDDDINEFDLLLEDDDEIAPRGGRTAAAAAPAKPRRSLRPAQTFDADDQPAAARLRVTPDWTRIAAVLFVAVIVALIAWFTISSIRHARRNGAYKQYFSSVRELASQSAAEGVELNTILTDQNAGDRTQRVQRVAQLSTRAAKLAKDAAAVDAPSQLAASQQWLVTSLDYRARGLASLQRSLTDTTKMTNKDKAASNVAAAMSRFVASDVVWSDSFAADARGVLRRDDVENVTVPDSEFVSDLDAVSPASVAKMLDRIRLATAATTAGQAVAPTDGKIRGGQLEGGRVTLAPSGTSLTLTGVNEVKMAEGFAFEIPFTNQGEVQLTDVPVTITLRGANSSPIELTGTIATVDPGETATATVPFNGVPSFGEVLTMDVLVGPILGEKKTDNNAASYQVQFSVS
ncbi:MAG: hypothetical protein JWN41_448 [Thermoleophilia bacterium]|nr:hypothetical protein [Thermoleophilia bacterium]